MSDAGFDLLGLIGPYLCHNCGHPFQAGECAVLVCGGEKVRKALNPNLTDELLDDEREGPVEVETSQRMTVFNLVHESCEGFEG